MPAATSVRDRPERHRSCSTLRATSALFFAVPSHVFTPALHRIPAAGDDAANRHIDCGRAGADLMLFLGGPLQAARMIKNDRAIEKGHAVLEAIRNFREKLLADCEGFPGFGLYWTQGEAIARHSASSEKPLDLKRSRNPFDMETSP